MADNQVRNIAPFINVRFLITSPWWQPRYNPVTGNYEYHHGLDIATSRGDDNVFSMLTGHIHSKGTNSARGNWVIVANDIEGTPFYGYATLYMHLRYAVSYAVGDSILAGQQVGVEGSTGQSTGAHLHVEMQDLTRFNWTWTYTETKSDYIDPTAFMRY